MDTDRNKVFLIRVNPCPSVAKFVSAQRWLSLIPRRRQNSGDLRRSETHLDPLGGQRQVSRSAEMSPGACRTRVSAPHRGIRGAPDREEQLLAHGSLPEQLLDFHQRRLQFLGLMQDPGE